MIPDRELSSEPVLGPYLFPDDRFSTPEVDYEYGGVALRNASQGLRVKVWTFRLIGETITVEADDVAPEVLVTGAGITAIAGAFDQNMNPAVAYVQGGVLKLYWYDSLEEEQVITEFGPGITPKICMDDKRASQTLLGNNDVIFCYVRDDVLYARTQRDRYEVEDPLANVAGFTLVRMGMNTVNRLQFQFTPIAVAA